MCTYVLHSSRPLSRPNSFNISLIYSYQAATYVRTCDSLNVCHCVWSCICSLLNAVIVNACCQGRMRMYVHMYVVVSVSCCSWMKNDHLLASCVISCSGRLYFTTLRGKPSKAPGVHFFNIDEEFVYQKWAVGKFLYLSLHQLIKHTYLHCSFIHLSIRMSDHSAAVFSQTLALSICQWCTGIPNEWMKS